jgi:Domain of unknown function (DUF4129)
MRDDSSVSPGQYLPSPITFKPWRELAVVAAIFMELSWITLWYRALIVAGKEVSFTQAFIVLSGLLLLFYTSNRLMGLLNIQIVTQRVVLLILLLLNLIIGMRMLLYTRESISLIELLNRPLRTFQDMTNFIPAEFIVMVLILLVSWRGISYSDHNVGPVNAIASFRLGIIMFFLYGFALPLTNEYPNQALYLFLFFGLLAMTTARIAVLSQLRGGHKIQFNRQWLLGILIVITGIIGVSAVVISFARDQMFALLYTLYTWIVYAIFLILSPLLFGLFRILLWFFSFIRLEEILDFLMQALRNFQNLLTGMFSAISDFVKRFNFESVQRLFDYVVQLKPFYLWAFLLMLVAVILLGVRKYIQKDDKVQEQEVSDLAVDEDLFQLLRSALRRGWDKLAENLEDLLGLRQARRLLAAARVRRIYALLLEMSAQLDHPRPASRTPLEFMPQLEGLFPALTQEVRTITDAYLLVRYGEAPETPDELSRVESAWKLVSDEGKEKIREKRHPQR